MEVDEEIKEQQRVLYRCNQHLHGLEILTHDHTYLRTSWLIAHEDQDPSKVQTWEGDK